MKVVGVHPFESELANLQLDSKPSDLMAFYESEAVVPPSPNWARKLLFGENLSDQELVGALLNQKYGSAMQASHENIQSQIELWSSLRTNEKKYFQDPLKIFSPEAENCWTFQFDQRSDKQVLRENISACFSGKAHTSGLEATLLLFEELFMNSTLDAPSEQDQNQGNLRPIRFDLAVDPLHLTISCTDLYGTLPLEKLIARMSQVLREGLGESINTKRPGGAGIGCVLMLQNCTALCFGVEPQARTVVTARIARHWSYRKRQEMKKSIHLVAG